ncbi:MAG: hypothetical protein AAGG68_01685 [Bacteroidota bacterium]
MLKAFTLTLIFLCIQFSSLFGQLPQSIFDYLSSSEEKVVAITIKANFDTIIAKKYTTDYHDATLEVKDIEETWDIKLRTRGRYRRRICDFPPIKLEFSKKDLEAKGLSRIDDLKLVTHCSSDVTSDSYVLREAMAYGLYNILTDNSFRHQVVKLTYINTGKKRYKIKRYGIIIEDEKAVAQRLGGMPIDTFGLAWNNIQTPSIELAACYQYMIGNTDWDIPMQRNLKFVYRDETEEFIAVPYDFDMSGLVNPTYGIPNPDLPIATLQDRYYLGLLKPSKETIAILASKKDALLKYCKGYKLLNGAHRSEVTRFIESFYEDLESGTAFMNLSSKEEKN